MALSPITSNILNLLSDEPVITKGRDTIADGKFSDILTEAFNTVAATDQKDKASAIGLITMESDDMSGMLLDAQKAEISLNLALQIRNKVVDAYNEVMRMQV